MLEFPDDPQQIANRHQQKIRRSSRQPGVGRGNTARSKGPSEQISHESESDKGPQFNEPSVKRDYGLFVKSLHYNLIITSPPADRQAIECTTPQGAGNGRRRMDGIAYLGTGRRQLHGIMGCRKFYHRNGRV